ncbi:hypothetical protein P3454_26415, partial [Vibrio parahaemolyticus]|nr:hypothetical protein [Vibrio parahaemolyticus]
NKAEHQVGEDGFLLKIKLGHYASQLKVSLIEIYLTGHESPSDLETYCDDILCPKGQRSTSLRHNMFSKNP